MKHTREIRPEPSRMKRRKFFGWLSVSVVGGMAGGSLLRKLISLGHRREEEPVVISHHTLSVPRTKKG